MKTILDTKNHLLNRREVKVLVESASNPGFATSQSNIATQFKAKEDSIAIKAVKSKFGRNTFLIDAYIYDSAEHKAKIEPKVKVKKKAEGAK